MVRRPTPPPKPERPNLTVEQKRRRIERLQKCIQELEAFDPQTVQKRFPPELTALGAGIDEALSAAFGHGTVEYERYSSAARLDHGPVIMSLTPDWIEARGGGSGYHDETFKVRQYITEGKQQSIVLIERAIRTLQDEIADQERDGQAVVSTPVAALVSRGRKVFVVHGHDEAALQAVARFLEKLKLEAVVLREEPDQGRTIIEKFEALAGEVGFAVVLLTPDDLAGTVGEPSQASRARQNVIFELGYFVGRLGRGRACPLRKGEVEIPSDLYGVIYSEMDAGEGWKLKLMKELKAAKLDFDANRMWG
jgi:predicted nucleotide-binding protein